MWNGEFDLPDGLYSVSDIPDYTEQIIKKHGTLTTIPPIHVYVKNLIEKRKNGENVSSLEVVEVVLVQ